MELLVKSMVLVACALTAIAVGVGLSAYFRDCPYCLRNRKSGRMADFRCGPVSVRWAHEKRTWAVILDDDEVMFTQTKDGALEYALSHVLAGLPLHRHQSAMAGKY